MKAKYIYYPFIYDLDTFYTIKYDNNYYKNGFDVLKLAYCD